MRPKTVYVHAHDHSLADDVLANEDRRVTRSCDPINATAAWRLLTVIEHRLALIRSRRDLAAAAIVGIDLR